MGKRELKVTNAEKKNGVGIISLNRVEKLNALNADMTGELNYLLDEFEADPELRVILLTGAGRAFCAGGDVGAEAGMNVVTAFHGE